MADLGWGPWRVPSLGLNAKQLPRRLKQFLETLQTLYFFFYLKTRQSDVSPLLLFFFNSIYSLEGERV